MAEYLKASGYKEAFIILRCIKDVINSLYMSLSSSSPSMPQINKSSNSQSVSDKSVPNTVGKCNRNLCSVSPFLCLLFLKIFVSLSGYQHRHEIILCVLFRGGRYKATQETMREVIPLMGV